MDIGEEGGDYAGWFSEGKQLHCIDCCLEASDYVNAEWIKVHPVSV